MEHGDAFAPERGFSANPQELQIIDGALAQLRGNPEAWRTLVVSRGLEDTYEHLKERVRRTIQAQGAPVAPGSRQ